MLIVYRRQPENLLLTEDGHIKVADFGSVKPMQGSQITVLPNAASGQSVILLFCCLYELGEFRIIIVYSF